MDPRMVHQLALVTLLSWVHYVDSRYPYYKPIVLWTLGDERSIRTPNYPQPYRDLEDSTWDVLVRPSLMAEGVSFTFVFEHFDLEDSPMCLSDYLQMYEPIIDGAANFSNTHTWCGTNVPDVLTTESDVIRFKFATDATVMTSGFHIRFWASETVCDQVILGYADTWNISHLASPGDYNSYQACYDLVVNQTTCPHGNTCSLQVHVEDMHVDHVDGCRLSHVGIFRDNSHGVELARFCGSATASGNFFTVGQSEAGLRVRLTKHGDRLNVMVKISQEPILGGCLGHFDLNGEPTLTAVLPSPGYPAPYPPNSDFCYSVNVASEVTPVCVTYGDVAPAGVDHVTISEGVPGNISRLLKTIDGTIYKWSGCFENTCQLVLTLDQESGHYLGVGFMMRITAGTAVTTEPWVSAHYVDPQTYFGAGLSYFIAMASVLLISAVWCVKVRCRDRRETLLGTDEGHHRRKRTYVDGLMLDGDADSGLVEITQYQADHFVATSNTSLNALTIECHSYQGGGEAQYSYANQAFEDGTGHHSLPGSLGGLVATPIWSTDESLQEGSPVEDSSSIRWESLPMCRHVGKHCDHDVDIHHQAPEHSTVLSTNTAENGSAAPNFPGTGYGTFGENGASTTPAILAISCQHSYV